MLFVSHNMAAIEALCSRCIVLDAGRVLFEGTPTDAVAQYLLSVSADAPGEWGEFDLSTRPEREHKGEHVLQRIRLLDQDAGPVTTMRMGDPLTVIVEVEGLDELGGAFVGMEIRSELDQALMSFHGNMKPPRRARSRGHREEVVFELGALPLMPGRYWLGVGVWDPHRSRLADRVERAASFEVAPANVYRSGYEVQAREGALFVDFEWELRPAEVDITELPTASESRRVR